MKSGMLSTPPTVWRLPPPGLSSGAGMRFCSAMWNFRPIPIPGQIWNLKGVKVKFLKSKNRCFDIETFEKAITQRTKVLTVSFVQFFNGFKNDIEKLGKICKQHNIFYVVDAIQGCGNIPIDVKKCHIDLLATGAQKWMLSPVGSGFFYLNKKAKLDLRPVFAGWFGIDWGGNWLDLLRHDLQPDKTVDRFNLSAMPYLQIYGMHSSIKLINSIGVDNIYQHNLALIDRLIEFRGQSSGLLAGFRTIAGTSLQ